MKIREHLARLFDSIPILKMSRHNKTKVTQQEIGQF